MLEYTKVHGKGCKVAVRVGREMATRIDRISARDARTRSDVVRALIEAGIDAGEPESGAPKVVLSSSASVVIHARMGKETYHRIPGLPTGTPDAARLRAIIQAGLDADAVEFAPRQQGVA